MEQSKRNKSWVSWAKRLGWVGVLFFTIKGLIWLAVLFGFGKILGL